MTPALFVLAILGCGEGDAPCQQVAVSRTPYVSAQACNDATAEAVERYQDVAFPVVVAQCRPADAKVSQQVMPKDVDLPNEEQMETVPRSRLKSARAAEEGVRI